mmetsp:Transcript_6709/g.9808  ORF Transcript_6709/g.9808 Transcript_6709/m.9808 type:complete len:527 (+) Transcript_6709:60-1640(+)|eukprot:CAMPEP_0196817080 /NCGR_PEP_ID=MMETSP1362-20130617/58676_1 /TAXON_ID=163516 /ORGANISM="Leptocylindrus danicus, Strain CCMP1856" /LENGTH=526 /DNA_ID=CAMNT_0042194637 /DNA_START=24 /DNA_END=1604 /DNA_ORIENTATION=-
MSKEDSKSSNNAALVLEEEDEEVDHEALLSLACEHDRVDIIQSLLDEHPELLNPVTKLEDDVIHIPPLHLAVGSGSVRATNCLLRLGADPSSKIEIPSDWNLTDEAQALVKYNDKTAYEVAFDPKKALNIPPNKLEGLHHAFCAEALRVIGSDEVIRLCELLAAGLPRDTIVGDSELMDWAKTLNGANCLRLLEGEKLEDILASPRTIKIDEVAAEEEKSSEYTVSRQPSSPSRQQPSREISLQQQLEENEALAQGLSDCLDNLVVEVGMCNQLLLVGGSALVDQVRTLKATKAQKEIELEHYHNKWVDVDEELQYLRRCFPDLHMKIMKEKKSDDTKLSSSEDEENIEEEKKMCSTGDGVENEKQAEATAGALLAASQAKVRKLRASIADLAEENTRNLAEIDRLGRSGAVNFARTLRDELRDVEFAVIDARAGEARCREDLALLKAHIDAIQPKLKGNFDGEDQLSNAVVKKSVEPENADIPSKAIQTGQSSAIVQRSSIHGFASFGIWDLLKRIIGFWVKTRS